jgi:hypothetical protein
MMLDDVTLKSLTLCHTMLCTLTLITQSMWKDMCESLIARQELQGAGTVAYLRACCTFLSSITPLQPAAPVTATATNVPPQRGKKVCSCYNSTLTALY